MSKPGRNQKQFNIKVTGASEIATIEAVQQYCTEHKINVSDFVVAALRIALGSELVPPDDSEILNQRVTALEQFVTEIKNDVRVLKSQKPKPSGKTKNRPTGKPEVRAISYLKADNILPKDIKPTDADIEKIFDGIDGSRWIYLGIQKSPTSGLATKAFQRV